MEEKTHYFGQAENIKVERVPSQGWCLYEKTEQGWVLMERRLGLGKAVRLAERLEQGEQ